MTCNKRRGQEDCVGVTRGGQGQRLGNKQNTSMCRERTRSGAPHPALAPFLAVSLPLRSKLRELLHKLPHGLLVLLPQLLPQLGSGLPILGVCFI